MPLPVPETVWRTIRVQREVFAAPTRAGRSGLARRWLWRARCDIRTRRASIGPVAETRPSGGADQTGRALVEELALVVTKDARGPRREKYGVMFGSVPDAAPLGAADTGATSNHHKSGGDVMPVRLREMDEQTTYRQQLQEEGDGAVVLINQFNVAPEDAESFLEIWADDAAFMKRQPGFISTQLHRGTAGSSTFMNVAVWESSRALGAAFGSREFQERAARYPDSTIAAPHLFEKVAVAGICVR